MTDFPDFIIAGAAKCGTTSLSRYLDAHPDIYLPERELNFYPFLNKKKGYKVLNHPFITRLSAYKKYFSSVAAPVKGEKSVSYFYPKFADEAIKNIIKTHPDPGNLKLIVILRNPVERAFSQYVYNREFHEKLSFEEAVKAWDQREKEGWIPAYDYLGAGLYSAPLISYIHHFNQIKIYLFDDLIENPQKLIKDMFSFLGVDENASGNYDIRHNVSKIPRNRMIQILYKVLLTYNPMKFFVKRLMTPDQYQALKLKYIAYTHYKPELTEGIRRDLVKYYKKDIKAVQKIIHRDLSHWLEV